MGRLLRTGDEALAWIITNQFGRRNLLPFVRAELALKLEPLLQKGAATRQAEGRVKGGKARWDSSLSASTSSTDKPRSTLHTLGGISGTGYNSVRMTKAIVAEAPEEVKAALRAGTTTINREYTRLKAAKAGPRRQRMRQQSVSGPTLIRLRW